MKLAVISDTHGHVPYTLEAIREIERRDPDLVIHCGDIGSPAVVSLFAGRTTRFVFGNVDYDQTTLRHAIREAGLACDGDFGEAELAGKNVAFLHGDDEELLDNTIRAGRHDLVCHGHTHRQRWEQVGTTLVLNPGAIYRATPHSFAIVTLPDLAVEFVALPLKGDFDALPDDRG